MMRTRAFMPSSALALAICAAILVLVPALALAVVGDFGQPASSPEAVGKAPSSVAAGNFNGDANADLVVANKDDANLTILLGDGSGDFTRPPTSPEAIGGSPWRALAGNFDGDSDMDLAAVLHEGKVAILLGDGNGDFVAPGSSPITVGGSPRNLALADLDNDSDMDLAIANFFPATVSILLNDGDGNFAVDGTLDAGGSATNAASIVAADLNGDTEPDLAVGSEFSNEVRVYINNGDEDGAFTALPSPETGFDASSLTAGKFDGDSDIDLAAADGSATTNVTILLNNGSGDFTPASTSPEMLPVVAYSLLAVELNGDSNLDLVGTGGNSPGKAMILLGNGSGDFSTAPNSPEATGGLPTWAAAANLGGSAATDLAIVNTNSKDVTILLNDFTAGSNPGGGGTPGGGGGSSPSTAPPGQALPPPGLNKPAGTKKACGKGKVRKSGKCVPCPKGKKAKKGKCVRKTPGRRKGRGAK